MEPATAPETTLPVHSASTTDPASSASKSEQLVTPWTVSGGVDADGKAKAIDYNKLIEQFGTSRIDQALLDRFERVTGHKPHRYLRRNIVFSHRDLETILDKYEKNEPFFLYTGRGPSSDIVHIGHMVPFTFTKWLADVFDVPLVIMLTDDEKFYVSNGETKREAFVKYARENAKDILALGFDVKNTFIFIVSEYMGGDFYGIVMEIAQKISLNTAQKAFGFDLDTNIGKIFYAAIQPAASFAGAFPHLFGGNTFKINQIPCLIPCAIDQDPYFRVTRDVASKLNYAKPSLIHARFLDALQGPGSKMSASNEASAIFMRDTEKRIRDKVSKSFSGGQETVEEHREKGGDPEIDVAYQYLRYFLEDDEELEKIRQDYRSGKLLTGEIKKLCSNQLIDFCKSFQEKRSLITDQILDEFLKPRPLMLRGKLSDTVLPVEDEPKQKKVDVADPNSKSQQKKLAKLQAAAEKKKKQQEEKEAKANSTVAEDAAKANV